METFVGLPGQPAETLYLLGMDFLGSPVWEAQLPRDAIDIPDELLFLSQRDSVMLGRAFADRAGSGPDAELRVVVAARRADACACADSSATCRPTRLFDGAIAVMDLPAAQRLLGREGQVDRIAVELAAGGRRSRPCAGGSASALGPAGRGRGAGGARRAGGQAAGVAAQHAHRRGVVRPHRGRAHRLPGGDGVGAAAPAAVRAARRRRHRALDAHAAVPGRDAILATLGVARGHARRLGAGVAGVRHRRGGDVGDLVPRWRSPGPTRSARGLVVAAATGFGIALAAAYLAARNTFSAPTVEALRPAAVETSRTRVAGRGRPRPRPPGRHVGMLLLGPTRPWLVVGSLIAAQLVAYTAGAVLWPASRARRGRAVACGGRGSRWLPGRLAAENFPRSPRAAPASRWRPSRPPAAWRCR